MTMLGRVLLLSALPALLLAGEVAHAAPAKTEGAKAEAEKGSPRAWLEAKVKEAHALATRKVKPDSPEEKAWQAEAKTLIDGMLDWDELTRRSLGSNWRKLEKKQQEAFSTLLRQLIEASYRSRLRFAVRERPDQPEDVNIDWTEEDVDENDASLEAMVKGGGKKALLGFELTKQPAGDWRVYDVAIDGLSTVRTYRSNFNKLIKTEGFDALMGRLKAKIADIEAGRADFARPGALDDKN